MSNIVDYLRNLVCETISCKGLIKSLGKIETTNTSADRIKTAGGAEIGGNIALTGTAYQFITNNSIIGFGASSPHIKFSTSSSGSLTYDKVALHLFAQGKLNVDDTTDATSTTDGSLQTDGGLSVAKTMYASKIYAAGDIAKTSTVTETSVTASSTKVFVDNRVITGKHYEEWTIVTSENNVLKSIHKAYVYRRDTTTVSGYVVEILDTFGTQECTFTDNSDGTYDLSFVNGQAFTLFLSASMIIRSQG